MPLGSGLRSLIAASHSIALPAREAKLDQKYVAYASWCLLFQDRAVRSPLEGHASAPSPTSPSIFAPPSTYNPNSSCYEVLPLPHRESAALVVTRQGEARTSWAEWSNGGRSAFVAFAESCLPLHGTSRRVRNDRQRQGAQQERTPLMKLTILFVAAGTFALVPAVASAGPRTPSPTTAPGQGQFNGQGYNHMHTQAQAKGQPGQTCQTLIANGAGATPGNAGSAPGSGSPFDFSDTKSGSHYSGSQLQNSRNTASVSQYDVACANQPH